MTPEVKALIDGMKAELDGMKNKVEALEKTPNVKAEDVAAVKAALDGLLAALPKPEAKTLAERVAALGESPVLATLGTDVAAMKAEAAEMKANLAGILAVLEKGGKSAVIAPQGSPQIGDKADPWGAGGKGASLGGKS